MSSRLLDEAVAVVSSHRKLYVNNKKKLIQSKKRSAYNRSTERQKFKCENHLGSIKMIKTSKIIIIPICEQAMSSSFYRQQNTRNNQLCYIRPIFHNNNNNNRNNNRNSNNKI